MSFNPSKAKLYRFISLMSNKMVLDVSQNPNDLYKLILYEWHGSSNQRFAIRQISTGKYAIFSATNNMVIAPEGGSKANGARIVLTIPQKIQSEFWTFEPVKHPKLENRQGFIIRNHSGHVIDVREAKCKNEQAVIQWEVNGNENQIWIVQEF